MASIYDFDPDYISERFVPPLLRKPKRLALLQVFLCSLKKKQNYIFAATNSFRKGFNVTRWSNVTAYTKGGLTRFGISVYEALVNNTGVIPSSDDTTWLLIEKDFVGADERVKYNGGKMLFEYVLNRYLNTTATTVPLIYIMNNSINTTGFYMGVTGDSKGYMGTNVNQKHYLGTSYSLVEYSYTIYVPIGIANSLTSETPDVVPNITANRENIVRGIADKYNLAGLLYNVVTV